MEVELCVIGKTAERYLQDGIGLYAKRLKHYLKFSLHVIPALRHSAKLSRDEIRKREASRILEHLKPGDHLVLLDERGKRLTSVKFAEMMEGRMHQSGQRVVFLVGGAYGVAAEVKARANLMLSFSDMTLSHQLIRLFFVEQLYRAMTILKNQPYHNEG